jgi:hypothetical protein
LGQINSYGFFVGGVMIGIVEQFGDLSASMTTQIRSKDTGSIAVTVVFWIALMGFIAFAAIYLYISLFL